LKKGNHDADCHEGMQPLLIFSVAAVLLPTASSAGPLPFLTSEAGVDFDVSCYPDIPGTWICSFQATIQDSSLVFLRWDLNGNGIYDYPDQTGGGQLGKWVTDHHVAPQYDHEGSWPVCLQGWDGYDVADGRPAGPVVCHNLALGGTLFIFPAEWDRRSAGRATASWELPAGYELPAGRASSVFLVVVPSHDKVPAIPFPCRKILYEPPVCTFRLDLATMSATFGLGNHSVFVAGKAGDGRFFSHPAAIRIF